MAPYSVPLFASPSKTSGRSYSGAVLGGGLGQPLTPDVFERLPQLLTAASSDSEGNANDALVWRGGLQRELTRRMSASEDRPGWPVQAMVGSFIMGALQAEHQAAGKHEQASPTAAQQREGARHAASYTQPDFAPAEVPWDGVQAAGMVCVPESRVAQQAVLAMQVRQLCHRFADLRTDELTCTIVPGSQLEIAQGIVPAIQRLQSGQLSTEFLPPAALASVLGVCADAGAIRCRLELYAAGCLQVGCAGHAPDATQQVRACAYVLYPQD